MQILTDIKKNVDLAMSQNDKIMGDKVGDFRSIDSLECKNAQGIEDSLRVSNILTALC
jgi:hypothetical protein